MPLQITVRVVDVSPNATSRNEIFKAECAVHGLEIAAAAFESYAGTMRAIDRLSSEVSERITEDVKHRMSLTDELVEARKRIQAQAGEIEHLRQRLNKSCAGHAVRDGVGQPCRREAGHEGPCT